jgi:hypothetical protein
VAGLVVVAAVLVLGIGVLAGDVVDAGRARSAADAAALAGVRGGRVAAVQLAAANGATLLTWAQSGDTVTVTVRVGDAVAEAKATTGAGEQ